MANGDGRWMDKSNYEDRKKHLNIVFFQVDIQVMSIETMLAGNLDKIQQLKMDIQR